MFADGLGERARFLQFHASLKMRLSAVIQFVDTLEKRIFERRFDDGVGRVGSQVLLRFSRLSQPAKFSGERKLRGAVPRKGALTHLDCPEQIEPVEILRVE
jgi:hypothetical protein